MKKMTARDVMNPHVIAIRADRTVQEAAVFLVEQAISGALVTDREDTPIGVVSMTDIVEMRSEESSSLPDVPEYYSRSWEYQLSREDMDELHIENPGRLVKDIMMPTVYTVPEDTRLNKVAQTMIAGRIHRLFVTQDDDVVGIVTTIDMLKAIAEQK